MSSRASSWKSCFASPSASSSYLAYASIASHLLVSAWSRSYIWSSMGTESRPRIGSGGWSARSWDVPSLWIFSATFRSPRASRPYDSRMDRFDIVVIGAGAAGEAAAHYARSRDASVAIIDRGLFGGSCPFWACMPSKALLHAAAVHHAGGDYPWRKASDFRDYMINREGTDTPDDSGHTKALEGAGATVIRGSASLDGPGRVRVGRS